MSKLDLGAIGVVVGSPGDADVFLEAAAALRALAYSTIWLAGPQITRLEAIGQVLDATRDVKVGTGIISVDQFDAAAVASAFTGIQAKHPDRLVVGLGGAHGPQPLRTLTAYLDALDSLSPTVPPSARILAALGPRMLQLARDRAAGGYPLLVTPDYTARARSLLGQDGTLVVGQFVVVEDRPGPCQAGRPRAAALHDPARLRLRGQPAPHGLRRRRDLRAFRPARRRRGRLGRCGGDRRANRRASPGWRRPRRPERAAHRPARLPPGRPVAPARRHAGPV
jgi:hypothetical protein